MLMRARLLNKNLIYDVPYLALSFSFIVCLYETLHFYVNSHLVDLSNANRMRKITNDNDNDQSKKELAKCARENA